MINKYRLVIVLVVLLIILIIGGLVYSWYKDQARFKVTKVIDESTTLTDIEKGEVSTSLTDQQWNQVKKSIRSKSSKEYSEDKTLIAIVRKGSKMTQSSGEITFIIDVPTIQSSYFVSRYVSEEDSVDILDISCVSSDKQIYKPDSCRNE